MNKYIYVRPWLLRGCWWLLVQSSLQAQAQEIRIQGRYRGENLFLQNPLHQSYDTFCINEVRLNGQLIVQAPRISAVEIKLQHLPQQAKVTILIRHKTRCQPKILNPEALKTVGKASFSTFYVQENTLFWKVKDEEPDAQYIVEYLNGDTWDIEASLPKSPDSSSYTYVPTTLVAGVNKFRIRYLSSTFYRYSTDIEILLKEKIITFSPQVVQDKMTLSERSYFEILNASQSLILQGETQVIPLRKLKPGDYFIVLDGKLYPFVKR